MGPKNKLQRVLESHAFENTLLIIILLNALVLGAETSPSLMQSHGSKLRAVDQIFLGIFVFELLLKLTCYRLRFFLDPWKIFDFLIVALALMPATGSLSALRAFRAFRLLRVISVLPQLRRVVSGLLSSIPSLGAVLAILGIIFYVSSVIATKLFGQHFPEWFGSIGASAYSLFQVMTLESWSMGIARVVMKEFPLAWMFFVIFILLTTFTMLNLFVAVMVNSMQAESEAAAAKRAEEGHNERLMMMRDLAEIKEILSKLQK